MLLLGELTVGILALGVKLVLRVLELPFAGVHLLFAVGYLLESVADLLATAAQLLGLPLQGGRLRFELGYGGVDLAQLGLQLRELCRGFIGFGPCLCGEVARGFRCLAQWFEYRLGQTLRAGDRLVCRVRGLLCGPRALRGQVVHRLRGGDALLQLRLALAGLEQSHVDLVFAVLQLLRLVFELCELVFEALLGGFRLLAPGFQLLRLLGDLHLRVVELPVGVGLRLVELLLRGVHESLPAFVLPLGLHRGFDAVGDIADQRVIVVAERVLVGRAAHGQADSGVDVSCHAVARREERVVGRERVAECLGAAVSVRIAQVLGVYHRAGDGQFGREARRRLRCIGLLVRRFRAVRAAVGGVRIRNGRCRSAGVNRGDGQRVADCHATVGEELFGDRDLASLARNAAVL